MPDAKTKTLVVKIQPDLIDWLKSEAQRRRTTVAYLVRTLIYQQMIYEEKHEEIRSDAVQRGVARELAGFATRKDFIRSDDQGEL